MRRLQPGRPAVPLALALLLALLPAVADAQPVVPPHPNLDVPRGPGDPRVNETYIPLIRITSGEQLGNTSSGRTGLELVGLSDGDMAELDEVPNVRRLVLRGNTFGDDALRTVQRQLGSLNELVIADNSRITDAGLEHIGEMTNLTALRLQRLPGITSAGLGALDRLGRLGRVELTGCAGLDDELAGALADVPSLWSITLRALLITDAAIARLRPLHTNLRELLLEDCTAITDRGVARLRDFGRLDSLSLAGCTALTDDALDALTERHDMRLLRLSRCNFTSAGMRSLSELRNIEYLDLSGCTRIGNGGIGALWPLVRKLEYLNLSDMTGIDDGALAALRNFAVLEWLILDRLAITGDELDTLNRLQRLQLLSLAGCVSLTESNLRDLGVFSLEELIVTGVPAVDDRMLQRFRRAMPKALIRH